MKNGLAKRLPLLVITAVLVATTGTALADTTNKPYIKTFGSDVMTGGWFSNGTNCSTGPGTNYQNPSFSTPTFPADARSGGILTYTNSSGVSSGGSSSQYGVYSLGEIDGRRAGDGFYSDGVQVGSSVKALTFANDDSTLAFGGKFEGTIPQGNCIPDYYAKKPIAAQNVNNLSEAIGRGSGDYKATAPAGGNFKLTNGGGGGTFTIPAGQRMTIYVDGNVYINSNIVYDAAANINNVPKLSLVVRGSLYIDNSVTRLDGLYVAEPSVTTPAAVASDNGIIWTCHPDAITTDIYYPPSCTSPLVINGALVAKQVNFLRVKGEVAAAPAGEDNISTVNSCSSGTCNVAEVVNYTPAVVLGGSFFNTSSNASSQGLPIDSIISLPPAF